MPTVVSRSDALARIASDEFERSPAPPLEMESSLSEPDEGFRPLPEQLVERFVDAATRRALIERLEDGTWYAEVRLLPGVWADGSSEDEAVKNLRDVVDSWVRFKIENRHRDIPEIERIDLNRA